MLFAKRLSRLITQWRIQGRGLGGPVPPLFKGLDGRPPPLSGGLDPPLLPNLSLSVQNFMVDHKSFNSFLRVLTDKKLLTHA